MISAPTRTGPARPPPRIAALDGVRGLAILMVIMLHGMSALPSQDALGKLIRGVAHWGGTGVDLFFVLSGFLITGILLDAKSHANYFRNFYARRVLRIFPAYYALLAFALLLLPHLPRMVGYYVGPAQAGNSSLAYWLYLSNFTIAFTGNAPRGMLDVTWSLAIEEQFYLLWPLLVLLCEPRTLMRVCGYIVIIAIALRTALVLAGAHWLVVYALTPCRMDALAVGAWIALTMREQVAAGSVTSLVKRARIVGAISLIAIAALIAWHRSVGWFGGPGQAVGYTAIAMLYGSLVATLVSAPAPALATRLFTLPALGSVGRYSYAMYLLHGPIASCLHARLCPHDVVRPILGSHLLGQFAYFALLVGATYLAALCSWHLLEKHFIRMKAYFENRDDTSQRLPSISSPAIATAAG